MKKVKRRLALLLALVTIVAGVPTYGIKAEAAETSGDYEYKVNEDGNSVTITKYIGGGGDVVIPSEIEGKKVTEIGKNAFFANMNNRDILKNVIISEGITGIGNYTF